MSWLRTVMLTGALVAVATSAHAAPEPLAPPASAEDPADDALSERSIVIWPTLTPAGDDAGQVPLHKPAPTEGSVYGRAQELDFTLRDAAQDLGFTIDVGDPGPSMGRARDLDIVDRASRTGSRPGAEETRGTWVVSARLEPLSGDNFLLRIVVAPPRSKQLRVRVEKVSGADVSVRGLVFMRDLLASAPAYVPEAGPRQDASAGAGIMSELRSQGRAVLAANAALFGAFTAYSIQRASGSDDPRLLYPLLTLGTGIGLGSALLVAAEWDVGTGDAWTLAGGAWWGAASGILIANGRDVQPLTDRYAWGVGGGLAGLGLATLSLTRGKADEGDAVLVHSGSAFGMSLGALSELFLRGDLEGKAASGAGYGAAAGLVTAGTTAVFARVSPSRVLLVDLGAGLGAAAGAAAGSPLVFENVTEEKTRGFLAGTAAGTLVGGGLAWWLTRGVDRPAPARPRTNAMLPFGGVVGGSATPNGNVPAYGVGVRGAF